MTKKRKDLLCFSIHSTRWFYLDDVTKQTVGRGIGALDLRPPARETELMRLEEEVRVLPPCKPRTL